MSQYFRKCERCGAHLDPGEVCYCNEFDDKRRVVESWKVQKMLRELKARLAIPDGEIRKDGRRNVTNEQKLEASEIVLELVKGWEVF